MRAFPLYVIPSYRRKRIWAVILWQVDLGRKEKTAITARQCFKLQGKVKRGREKGCSGSDKHVYGVGAVPADMAQGLLERSSKAVRRAMSSWA